MKPKKTSEIKARIEDEFKTSLRSLAAQEHLDLSDILRRAVREFITRRNENPSISLIHG